jgi:hypothetical protein
VYTRASRTPWREARKRGGERRGPRVGVRTREPAAAQSWRATSAFAPATRDRQTHCVRPLIRELRAVVHRIVAVAGHSAVVLVRRPEHRTEGAERVRFRVRAERHVRPERRRLRARERVGRADRAARAGARGQAIRRSVRACRVCAASRRGRGRARGKGGRGHYAGRERVPITQRGRRAQAGPWAWGTTFAVALIWRTASTPPRVKRGTMDAPRRRGDRARHDFSTRAARPRERYSACARLLRLCSHPLAPIYTQTCAFTNIASPCSSAARALMQRRR